MAAAAVEDAVASISARVAGGMKTKRLAFGPRGVSIRKSARIIRQASMGNNGCIYPLRHSSISEEAGNTRLRLFTLELNGLQ